MSSYEGDSDRPTRRKKLLEYLKVANDVRQSYQQYYSEKYGSSLGQYKSQFPKSNYPEYPDSVASEEKLLLFPSYAKRHLKATQTPDLVDQNSVRYKYITSQNRGEMSADIQIPVIGELNMKETPLLIDVDVRGCLYLPPKGAMTRKHRILVGIARQLCDISHTKILDNERESESGLLEASSMSFGNSQDKEHIFYKTEQLRKQCEDGNTKSTCNKSINVKDILKVDEDIPNFKQKKSSSTAENYFKYHLNTNQSQLNKANSNLMERLGPFMANLLEFRPLTICFYNEAKSASRTIKTDEMGHFIIREVLNFIPTHVRVQLSDNIHVTEKVKLIEPIGVSLISDIDDTVKNTSIDSGAREVFRNTFIRDFQDLTIDGVKEWYNIMYDMGVEIHYVSNSPWQLFPTLLRFFKGAGLPIGSYHLKSYTGMLQGILEPTSERKKPTIMKILTDFPDRSFILVGDSSEADLEVYCDIALANPGRVMMILIRNTIHDFFDHAINTSDNICYNEKYSKLRSPVQEKHKSDFVSEVTEKVTMKGTSTSINSAVIDGGPIMGRLIDFGDEKNNVQSIDSVTPKSSLRPIAARELSASRKRVPPPRPPKPAALRVGSPNLTHQNSNLVHSLPSSVSSKFTTNKGHSDDRSNNQSLKYKNSINTLNHSTDTKSKHEYKPLFQSDGQILSSNFTSLRLNDSEISTTSQKQNQDESAVTKTTYQSLWGSGKKGTDEIFHSKSIPVNKKLEIWRRRWKKAEQVLSSQGVKLRSWRVGGDVYLETIRNIEEKLLELETAEIKK
ncbi:putative actin cytoskeleton organization protein app1 [Erysiphe neolycopersici]|uniref:Putative actin cytoskeleton organization protein app1 n=1 Tax=Erysiphe neolycopersici TaxID=212602 RepID=A0A420HCS2_9PEZI|nr:putative actin cytoskeleton organization protein app1 [Erysiphe neolycopersici]